MTWNNSGLDSTDRTGAGNGKRNPSATFIADKSMAKMVKDKCLQWKGNTEPFRELWEGFPDVDPKLSLVQELGLLLLFTDIKVKYYSW